MNKDDYCLFPGCTEDLSLAGIKEAIHWCHKHEAEKEFQKGIFLRRRTKYLEIDEDVPEE